MAQNNFSATINKWVAETKERQTAVFQDAVDNLISAMQTPGPSVANPGASGGGALPVDSGFLRSSLQVVIGLGLPVLVGNPNGAGEARSFRYDSAATSLVISNAKMGDTITVAYAAEYAVVMEARYAFVRLSAQRWQQFVSASAARAEASVKSRE